VLVVWSQQGPLVLDPASDFASRPLVPDGGGLFLPSAEDDRVWVEIVNADGPSSGEGSRSIREMTIDGDVTVPDVVLPGGFFPLASVGRYLAFQGLDGSGLSVWDPRTGEFVDHLEGQFPLASRGDVLAWCQGDCEAVHITDFATGDDTVVVCPGGTFGFEEYEGAFSPDGRTLALALRIDFGRDSRRALTLVDVETGYLDVVDDTNVEPGYVYVDWSPSGESVFITGGSDERHLIEYRPSDGEARTIPVEVGDFYGMAAV
jgi:WD40 repeat protein